VKEDPAANLGPVNISTVQCCPFSEYLHSIPRVYLEAENDSLASYDKKDGCNLCLLKIVESRTSRMKVSLVFPPKFTVFFCILTVAAVINKSSCHTHAIGLTLTRKSKTDTGFTSPNQCG
jgi:hypothetical protein